MGFLQNPDTALIVVDVQNDFLPGGALPVPEGDAVIGPINRLIRVASTVGSRPTGIPPSIRVSRLVIRTDIPLM